MADEPKLNIPGVVIEEPVELDDFTQARITNEAERSALEAERIETRKKSIIASVQHSLARGERVTITPEMEELGLAGLVRSRMLTADFYWGLNQKLLDDSDSGPEESDDWL
jgi:hypothetical protein